MTARDLDNLISSYQLCHTSEVLLQRAIEEVLTRNIGAVEREVRLSTADRPDFMVWLRTECCGQTRCIRGAFCKPGGGERGIAIEVKVDGSQSEVMRQLHRYAQHDKVIEILLVTTEPKHRGIPEQFNGKPIVTCWIGGTAGL
jgi:hypothetical protein